jgi:hypothetical protein
MPLTPRQWVKRIEKLVEGLKSGDVVLEDFLSDLVTGVKEQVMTATMTMMGENPEEAMGLMAGMAETMSGKKVFIKVKGAKTPMLKVLSPTPLEELMQDPLNPVQVSDATEAEIDEAGIPGAVVDVEILTSLFNEETLLEYRSPGLTGDGKLAAGSAVAQGNLIKVRRMSKILEWMGGFEAMMAPPPPDEGVEAMKAEMQAKMKGAVSWETVAPVLETTLEKHGC